MRIALFVTCLVDALFPDAGKATVAAAASGSGTRSSSRWARPAAGRCTSTPATRREALPLVRRLRRRPSSRTTRWSRRPGRASGRCGTSTSTSPATAGDEDAGRRAEAVGRATYELSELLVDVLGVTDVGAYYPHRVTYHPTCHSLRMLRVGDRPLRLLRAVRGLDLVELPGAEECCGFGGTFAVKNADASTAMLADKMRAVLRHRRRGLHGRRLVLPAAHRRRPVPAAHRRPDRAPGRDPAPAPRTSRRRVTEQAR